MTMLAKSDGETILEHTQNLLNNYSALKEIYPLINVNWHLLELACIYHDFGKINDKFQKKVKQNIRKVEGELPHGLLSTAFIPIRELREEYTTDELRVLTYAIALHHERDMREITRQDYENEVALLKSNTGSFVVDELGIEQLTAKPISKKYFEINVPLRASNTSNYHDYVMLKGLLNRIDFAASAHLPVEHRNGFLEEDLENLHYQWNPLQQYMRQHQEDNVVVVAQTGLGKTEAGLLWLGNHKGFFTLPLRTAINSIYKRIITGIVTEDYDNKVGLLHSDIYQQYLQLEENNSYEGNIDEYENKTRQLSLPLTICTLDQLFDFVFQYAGSEHKLATLSYSKVIIDEIQMYSADLLAYLIYGLKMITDYGGKFAILTATLPPYILDLLKEENITFEMPEKEFIDDKLTHRHQLKTIHEEIDSSFISEHYNDNKILVICNTVKQAKRIYNELAELINEEEVYLLHSQFIKKDRNIKETNIMEFGRLDNKDSGIWVTTQVVEASVDVDFDMLFTELSDLSGLFQRMGRCYRKRAWTAKVRTNVYVFDGGDSLCSGVGYVVDKEIHTLSKDAMKDWQGELNERQKMQLINETYQTSKVTSTVFYQSVKNNLKYLKIILTSQKTKKEVQQTFRNIHNYSVIPCEVYEDNRKEIDTLINTIAMHGAKNSSVEEKRMIQKNRKHARIKLNDYKVDIPYYVMDKYKEQVVEIPINDYEKLLVLDCLYDFNKGITYKQIEKESVIF